jgi:UPF0716 family protein affecting phage T7 exclusion
MIDIVTAAPLEAPLSQALAWSDLLAAAAVPEPGMLTGLLGFALLVCMAIAWLTPAAPGKRARYRAGQGGRTLPAAAEAVR